MSSLCQISVRLSNSLSRSVSRPTSILLIYHTALIVAPGAWRHNRRSSDSSTIGASTRCCAFIRKPRAANSSVSIIISASNPINQATARLMRLRLSYARSIPTCSCCSMIGSCSSELLPACFLVGRLLSVRQSDGLSAAARPNRKVVAVKIVQYHLTHFGTSGKDSQFMRRRFFIARSPGWQAMLLANTSALAIAFCNWCCLAPYQSAVAISTKVSNKLMASTPEYLNRVNRLINESGNCAALSGVKAVFGYGHVFPCSGRLCQHSSRLKLLD